MALADVGHAIGESQRSTCHRDIIEGGAIHPAPRPQASRSQPLVSLRVYASLHRSLCDHRSDHLAGPKAVGKPCPAKRFFRTLAFPTRSDTRTLTIGAECSDLHQGYGETGPGCAIEYPGPQKIWLECLRGSPNGFPLSSAQYATS